MPKRDEIKPMSNKIAYCGIYCGACKIFISSKNNEIKELAEQTKIPVEYLECHGCRSKKNNLCCMNCGIKRCCMQKEIEACNQCEEFPCSVLKAFDNDEYPHHSGVIDSLKELSANGQDTWLKKQNKRWSCTNCQTIYHWYETECENCGKEVNGFKTE